ncbi:MipA/OmpV family protein [Marinomonas transparens]|uniref:MipA/OmpV family protein n=1 Tax=Marinomonas transparens TaxID=2795388 RepID=A0A934JT03_9GAMM|nr:MipA/OmpV family protein [Marinomonas transparens]MBJ7536825.1 MipA/OmpV family protein [Marinomonas transparens]
MKKTVSAFLFLTPLIAQANGSLGIFGTLSESIYKDTDSKSRALPNISYEGENFYFKLPEIGYRFLPQKSMQNLAVGVAYQASKFDPDDSSDTNIKQLDDRDDSVMAFASYQLGRMFKTKLAQDISGTHDGFSAEVELSYPMPVASWRVIPSISYSYMDSKMSNHAFGVSQSESAQTGGTIAAYDSSSVSLVTYGIKAMYPVTKSVNIMLGVSQSKYDDDILNSPLVEDDTVNSALAGIMVNF